MIKHNLNAGLKAECWVNAGYDALKPLLVLGVSEVLHLSPTLFCERNIQIEMIRAWLHKIEEPASEHYLVLDKCKDPDALVYFLELSQAAQQT